MLQGLTGWHFLIILLVILLIFGAARLPALARSLGQSARVFKGEMKEMKKDDEKSDPASSAADASATTVTRESAPRASDPGDRTP